MPLVTETIPQPWRRIVELSERDPRRAAAIAQRVKQPPDAPSATWALFAAGWTALRWERFALARDALAGAARAAEAQGLLIPQLHSRFGLLLADLSTGARPLAEADWMVLADDYVAAGQPDGAVPVLLYRALHLINLGRHRAALEVATALDPRAAAPPAPGIRARLDRVAAIAYEVSGEPRRAEALLDQAAAAFAALRWPVEVAKCQLERAWQWQRRERFDAAHAELQLAMATFRHFRLPLSEAHCARNLGLVASRLGRYDRSIAETMRARVCFVQLGRADLAADCDMALGGVAYYAQLFDLARAAYRRAQDAYEQIGSERLALLSQRNQALTLRAQGEPAEALALLDALAAPVESLGDQLEAAEILLAQAQALADLGRSDEALARSAAAQARFAALGNLPGAAKGALQQGWIHLAREDTDAARRAMEQARADLRELPVHRWRAEHGLGQIAERDGRVRAALDHYRTASQIVTRLRQTLASEHASSGVFRQAQDLIADALRLSAADGDASRVLELAEQQRALALLRQVRHGLGSLPLALRSEHEQHRAALLDLAGTAAPADVLDGAMRRYAELLLHAQSLHAIADDGAADPIDLARLRATFDDAYPRGWSVLTFVRCGDELLTVTYWRDGCALDRTAVDARLRALLERATRSRYRSLTYLDLSHAQDPTLPPWQSLAELGERLIPAQLRARLGPDHRLLIIPDGLLHALPWAALRVGGSWLCEQAVIQIVPSLSLWEALRARRPGATSALLVGCSQFQGRAADLPHVSDELDLVAGSWHGDVQQMRDAQATTARLRTLAEQGALHAYQLIHLASHAQLVSQRGVLAHVKLWDDDLWLDDLARLSLGGASVVMTGCDGANSDVLPGEEFLGLSRALLAAGARDVVASLWRVRDGATLKLLGHFYEQIGRGHDPAQALALAQRAILGGMSDDPVRSSLLVWAHYCAIGACCATEVAAGGTTPAVTIVERSAGS